MSSKIVKKLSEWQDGGLLEAAQVAAIARYEEERARAHRGQWVVWGIGAVGALTVATGVVSLVAANWAGIPKGVKLFAALSLMLGALAGAGVTAGRARADGTSTLARDLFLLLHAGLTLATVGLVAQIYHLHGHPHRAFALCGVLALPAAVVATRGLFTYVVLGHATIATWFYLDELGWHDAKGVATCLAFAALGLLLLTGGRLLAKARAGRAEAAAALVRWGAGALTFVAIDASAAWASSGHGFSRRPPPPEAVPIAASLFAVALVATLVAELREKRHGIGKRLLALAIFVALVAGGAMLAAHGATNAEALLSIPTETPAVVWNQLVGFALGCSLCIALAVATAEGGSQGLTRLVTFALAARIVAFYLEVAKDLMTTGAGLIATGAVLFGVAYGWWRLTRMLPIARAREEGAS